MIDYALHRWIEENPHRLTPLIRAKIHVNFPADLMREPTTNYIETAHEIRQWAEPLGLEYDL